MPTSASSSPPDLLCDTSAAVPLLVGDHSAHQATVEAVGRKRLGLAGHSAFETFSVLTRLPPPARRSPLVVRDLLRKNFPASRFLSARGSAQLADLLAELGIAGGAVYDALVGAAAAEAGVTLVSRDRRAADVYRQVDAEVAIID